MELITVEINWEYIIFGAFVVACIIVFRQMWKKRKKVNDGEIHDPWA